MTWNYTYTPQIWPPVLMAVLMTTLSVYCWRRRSVPGAIPLMVASLLAALWAAGSLLEYAAVDLPTKIIWFKVQAATQVPIAIAITCFILEYAWPGRWLTRRNLALLALPGLLAVVMILTDDLITFRRATERLGVEHQICQFHVRRWVGRTLYELRDTVPKDWLWVLDEIKTLLTDLPPDGSRRLFELWKQIPEKHAANRQSRSALCQLRDLLIRLSEYWPSYRVFDWQKDVPWTNNATEQAIGRIKMRSRTVRGYKSWQGMWAAGMLSCAGTTW